MENMLKAHVEELFAGTAMTRKALELKEEIIQNVMDRYSDLLEEGKSPDAAYGIAVSGIGDIGALLKMLEQEEPDYEYITAQRQKSAMYTSIAVMLYILSVLPLVITQILIPNTVTLTLSLSVLLAVVAGATGLMVYNSMTKLKERKPTESPEARRARRRDRNLVHGAVSSAMWILIVILYFVISFATWDWYITWTIFLFGAIVESLLSIFMARKNNEDKF